MVDGFADQLLGPIDDAFNADQGPEQVITTGSGPACILVRRCQIAPIVLIAWGIRIWHIRVTIGVDPSTRSRVLGHRVAQRGDLVGRK